MEEQLQEELKNENRPKKSKAGRIFLIIILVILLVFGGGIFWGYRKIASMTKPVNLGVGYSIEDYNDLVENIGIDVESEKLCLDCPALNFSQPHEVKVVVTNSQASAAFDIVNEKLSFGGISNSQVKFSENMGELSTVFTYNGKDYPIYISGAIEKSSERTISGEIIDVKVGSFNVPTTIKTMAEDWLLDLANERFNTMGATFRIDEIKLTEQGLDFEGLVPTKAE